MEVLCLGLERTGTLSLRAALLHLGYFDVYHMSSPMIENPPDCEMWVEAIDAKFNHKGHFPKEKWDKLLGHCMAVTDQPAASFANELVEAYPNAKVILTVRDSPEAWRESVVQTIGKLIQIVSPKHIREPGWNPVYHLQRLLAPRLPAQEFFDKLLVAHGGDGVAEEGVQMYLEHNEMVRRLAQSKQFLEYSVKDRWGPLCKFLGKPVPDIPFPRINDSADYAKMLTKLRIYIALGYGVNLLKVLAIPILAVGAMYYLRE